jgi:phosphoserine phosphatase
MGGTVLFQNALAARLDIIKPSKQDIQNFLSQHPLELTDGIEQLVNLLHSHGKLVFLVSGGFRQVLEKYIYIYIFSLFYR